MEEISQLINFIESLILQEINFDRVCNLYEDMTQNKFTDKPKFVIKLKSENDEQITYSVEELNDSFQFLDRKHHFRSDEHKSIESKIAVIEQKLNDLVLNLIKLYKYGVNKKLIERTDELEFAAEKIESEIKSNKEQTSRHLDSQSIYNTFTNFFRASDKTRKDSSVSKV
jgi:hydroxylamine reductase (hybrid-cluster protein)